MGAEQQGSRHPEVERWSTYPLFLTLYTIMPPDGVCQAIQPCPRGI